MPVYIAAVIVVMREEGLWMCEQEYSAVHQYLSMFPELDIDVVVQKSWDLFQSTPPHILQAEIKLGSASVVNTYDEIVNISPTATFDTVKPKIWIEKVGVDGIERKQGANSMDVDGWMRNAKRLAVWSAVAAGTAVFWYTVVNQGLVAV